ncbi:hypothetical protein SARC_06639 [Sphaeroforma arctica JP610]|uniref:Peptidase M16 N-terminal domain-containing protein n=1 Tax=Sphaeroforma arctica JP610 TaxID=667725 RepID=A0A0L0FW05_9EUKA|nr:hypothetical protein SARC_06639 [Sphaeroforma arctica JP610]KNC81025.1 hypothetical protein SARC_06639 [Sphaeroforma arctica JP610]|eukprot:XP_014154927.1 hypothetical protein SARC_06639 [Sphaeroforma arctica JP610]
MCQMCISAYPFVLKTASLRHFLKDSSYKGLTVVEISKLSNGITVASLETYSPISTVGVVSHAGARFEGSHNKGVAALNRQMAFKSTTESTQFAIVREIEHYGGRLHSTTTREHSTTTATGSRDSISTLVDAIADDFTNREALLWEVNQAKSELAIQSAEEAGNGSFQAIEAVHAASFSGGLANALTPAPYAVSALSPDAVKAYNKAMSTTGNSVLVGVGCQHSDLVAAAETAFGSAPSGEKPKDSCTFSASTMLVNAAGPATYVAVAFEGKPQGEDALKLAVIQHALGAGTDPKWGNSGSYLSRKLAENKSNTSLVAFNASYSDTGIIGIVAGAGNAQIGNLVGTVKEIIADVGKNGLSADDIAAGKAAVAAAASFIGDDANVLIEEIGAQVGTHGSYMDAEATAKKVEALTPADINKLAKSIFSSKPSVGAYGEVSQVPKF